MTWYAQILSNDIFASKMWSGLNFKFVTVGSSFATVPVLDTTGWMIGEKCFPNRKKKWLLHGWYQLYIYILTIFIYNVFKI